MKPTLIKHSFLILELILVSACTFLAPPATPTSAPAEIPNTGLVTVDLAGPEMKVGSKFLYADGSVLVAVPGGQFIMGANGPDNPQHQVNLSEFWIYSAKVTNGQFAYCVAMGLCHAPLHTDDQGYYDTFHVNDPVVGVTYDEATAYCSFVHGRLPTEAEWEKAARGPDGNIYPWGNGAPSCDLLNYGTCVGNSTPVNQYPSGQSYYLALDMEGNVLEWVSDWYKADYYKNSPADNPQGPGSGQFRSVRSSAFNSGGNQTQAFNRFFSPPDTHRANLGFRCVVNDPTYFAPFCNYPATYGTDGIGGATGGPQPQVDCPNLEINQNMQCNGTTPITYVTFEGSDDHTQDSCQPDPNVAGQYDCSEDGELTICGACQVTLTSDPQCPDGYTYDSETQTCVGHPVPSGACLPGFTITSGDLVRGNPSTPDASTETAATGQCCAFTPSNTDVTLVRGDGIPFPSCPAGTSYDGQECISTTLQPFCKSAGISFNSCSGGNGGEGCPPPAGGCPMSGEAWNSKTCSCYCPGGPGACG